MLTAGSDEQLLLPLGPVRNSELFSNYWLRHRLPLEPEWGELRADALKALSSLRELWNKEKDRVERYGSEAPLEQAFIQPVFERLGWNLFYQAYVSGRKPDYALFLSGRAYETALGHGRKSPRFWEEASIVADAKAWHVSLDKPHRLGSKREYPPEQVEWYLDRTRVDWGILTNGRLWRLIPRQLPTGRPRFQTYLEVDLQSLLERVSQRDQLELGREDVDEFLYFYLLFSRAGFSDHDGRRAPLVARALLGSSEYAVGVSRGLRDRVFEALRLCVQGFLDRQENHLSPTGDLELCREQSFTLLYRLLFIMYAEDRGLLPYRRNSTYTKNRSLARQRDDIAHTLQRKGGEAFSRHETRIWDDLETLFDLVDSGHRRYEVPPYNGGLFSSAHHPFLVGKKISDFYVSQIIDQLGRTRDQQDPLAGLFRVDYRDLAIRQLGSVYEGLLELRPRFAEQRMVVVRSKKANSEAERVIPAREPIPIGYRETEESYEAGSVFLETEKGERRATGSYYTPDHVVDHIVESTLSPLCKEIQVGIEDEIRDLAVKIRHSEANEKQVFEERLAEVQGEFDDRVLRLRVLDPAMGSGHFLVRACQYLGEEIATNPYTADTLAEKLVEDEPTLVYWKRKVAEHCLYGVDYNPLAVELAKLALWLETVSTSQPLTFLDHHLRFGNSLVGARLNDLGGLPDTPPLFSDQVADEFESRKGELLALLDELSDRESATTEDVKAKEKTLARVESRSEGLRVLADLWCGTYFAPSEAKLNMDEYAQVVQNLSRPKKLAGLLSVKPFRNVRSIVREEVAPFHWQLEFLDVFYGDSVGFDAVVGNPPYDVLAGKEIGADLSALKDFLRSDPVYGPSFRGKNNLYKLFVCRAVEALREGGRLGFIVPMAILGDDYAVEVRKLLLGEGRFTEIHAFPQKDDPKRRVFPEAKLSTAVFGYLRVEDEGQRKLPFRSIRHPEATFDEHSPGLSLSTEDIPLYDPSNVTIVSCAQEDWDLAVRMFKQGRMVRLGDSYESFQGEVNETTVSKRGLLLDDEEGGPLIMRGSNVALYAVREASQGEAKYLRRSEFLEASARGTKAWHSQEERIGFQRSSPQNNFRRIIAARMPQDYFCFDTVGYVPSSEADLSPGLLLALLNSKLLDWYFRLGSTNSKVNQYQFDNLPCPRFARLQDAESEAVAGLVQVAEEVGADALLAALPPKWLSPPYPSEVAQLLEALAVRIEAIEGQRGRVGKRARSHLADEAAPYQAAIDLLLLKLAGFSDEEMQALDERLAGLL